VTRWRLAMILTALVALAGASAGPGRATGESRPGIVATLRQADRRGAYTWPAPDRRVTPRRTSHVRLTVRAGVTPLFARFDPLFRRPPPAVV